MCSQKLCFSLFPSRTVGKYSSFNGFLELTHHVAKVKKTLSTEAVFSLVPNYTIAKRTSFNSLLESTHHVAKV